MKKMHTRAKRNIGLTSSKRRPDAPKTKGPRTFTSKEAADAWAKANNIKKYELVSAKKNKKFMIKTL